MKLLGLTLLVWVVGCATLTPEGARVRVTENSQATAGCKLLGRVKAADQAGDENALRNMTAQIGGNLLFLVPKVHEAHFYTHGEAYLCPPQ